MGHVQSSCCSQNYHKCSVEDIADDGFPEESSKAFSKLVRFAADDEELSTDDGESYLESLDSRCSSLDKDDDSRPDRKQTFRLLNAARSDVSEDEDDDSNHDDEKTKERAVRRMLAQIAHLVDKSYDVLPAEALFADLEKMVSAERWTEIRMSPLFERFCRKLDFFYAIGATCCQHHDEWTEVYNCGNGAQTVHCFIDKEDSRIVHYQARTQVPTSLENVICIANEVTLMKHWNGLVSDDPEVIGRRTAHYMVSHYQMSALGGLYKVDVLNEVRRFSDVQGGFICEHISSPPTDHPSYREPKKGFKRVQTETRAIHLACGPEKCLSISGGKVKLPFSAHKLPLKTIGQLAGRACIGGLIKNALRVKEEGSPWNKLIQKDEFDLYHRVKECMDSEGSTSRLAGQSSTAVGELDLEELFSRRRFYKPDSRTPVNNKG